MTKVHTKVISLTVVLATFVHYVEAISPEEIPQCIDQVADGLRSVEIPPVIKTILSRSFPQNGTEHDYEKQIDAPEINTDSCVEHVHRYTEVTDQIQCHLDFAWSQEYLDDYINAILHKTDEHTKFFFLGASICRWYLFGDEDPE